MIRAMRHDDDDDDLHRRLQRASTPFGLPAPSERVVRIVRVWVFGLSCTYTPDYTVANANTHSHPHTGRILSTSCNIVTHNLTSPFMRTGSNHTSPNTHPHHRPRGRYTRTRIHALRIIRIYIYTFVVKMWFIVFAKFPDRNYYDSDLKDLDKLFYCKCIIYKYTIFF